MSKGFPRKILYSPGYGAGWASWADNNEIGQFVAEYQPIIEWLEQRNERGIPENHPLMKKLKEDLLAKFGEEVYFYTGGARDLAVATVHNPYRIEEYDGFESIKEIGKDIYFY